MALFAPYKILSTQLNSLPIVEGQFIITSDTKRIYLDTNSTTRIDITSDVSTDDLVHIGTDEPTSSNTSVWVDTDGPGVVIPTKTSELTNDSNFATTDQIPTKTSELTNDSDFATNNALPTKTSQLTNDSKFVNSSTITSIWVGTQAEYNSISTKNATTLYCIKEA